MGVTKIDGGTAGDGKPGAELQEQLQLQETDVSEPEIPLRTFADGIGIGRLKSIEFTA